MPLTKPLPQSADPLAVQHEVKQRLSALQKGIERYIRAPERMPREAAHILWQSGNARLLYYPAPTPRAFAFVVPSLINRHYILDLTPEYSLLTHLNRQGIGCAVMDWGDPTDAMAEWICADYITRLLLPALEHYRAYAERPVSLVGYCMGGVLALALSLLRKESIGSLALLAAPWNFEVPQYIAARLPEEMRPRMERYLAAQPLLPGAAVSFMFHWMQPWTFHRSFMRLGSLPEHHAEATHLLAMQQWAHDAVALTRGVAKECILGWVQENRLMNGKWEVGGTPILPEHVTHSTFLALPKHDHVVPAAAMEPLAARIPSRVSVMPDTGHVGMISGPHAPKELWEPLTSWLLQHAAR